MEVQYRTKSGLIFKIPFTDQKKLWEDIAQIEDVFDSDDHCGLCQSPNIRHRVRVHDDNKFYELRCLDCGAQLAFGQHKKGDTLFPKRSGESGPLPNRGWYKWSGKVTRNDDDDDDNVPF